ncbi:uncharacterized protein FOMMEDRAFT_23370 [Fomitiporia mediterranea MF3/22]|uniref:uncharacterized protein n=1 Tax=Fomitiporia mediterranea (strain MF3/22) TaxID=694068 RepID=UPI00044082BA|nr:uncharacterized protein FOMMEDRAFT_23370 [Fomitiporia mediterranea MF3/22]EJC99026.1 hypothetical protein FOMMEDRAFT_23370 [Fomitiporia mediterranea MF3/22]
MYAQSVSPAPHLLSRGSTPSMAPATSPSPGLSTTPTPSTSGSTAKSSSHPKPKPVNVFTNDGSFLERFQRVKKVRH